MDDLIKVYEVGPRDGLQNEATPVPTDAKLALIDGLIRAGLRHIEATSFVHPKAVPQLADADTVMAGAVARHVADPVQLVGLVFNDIGYERALAAGCRAMAFGVAVSDTFSRRNTRNSRAEALVTAEALIRRAHQDDIWTRVYVMTAWVCPFEGLVDPLETVALVDRLWGFGVDELSIADTIGHAQPLAIGRLLEQLARRTDIDRLAVHLHDTQALGLTNAYAALRAGVRIFDTSVGGLGGCPFAPGAAGNLATEDLVFMAYKMGLGTGVDFRALWEVIAALEAALGRPIGGRIRPWWESDISGEPSTDFI
jgi:hydroxymethylglutaryl-CoA lyase